MTALDDMDMRTCLVGLRWIARHRELHDQPPSPSIDRAVDNITTAMSASGPEEAVAEHNWLTTTEAAQRLGCSTRHVRRKAEALGGRKDGRDWLIPEGAL